jgi:N4-(beta-N-acetylglucosaminyl)-L-asparaginase
MNMRISRRGFLMSSTTAGLIAARPIMNPAQAPAIVRSRPSQPLVISSANGNKFKNGGDLTCVQKAFQLMSQGADVLDALIAGVNIVELDPEENSVGYGGLPNADGVVQLDASCMHGPKKRAGAVAALEGVRTPSLVARAVMDNTDHLLLVGRDAQTFARNLGFTIEGDLNTERSRQRWLEWKRRTDSRHYLDPKTRAIVGHQKALEMVAEGLLHLDHLYGTINCDGINGKGEMAGVTTTSGLAFKIPGRVGDSPIIGAGLYVDGTVGAAGSTGRGEANLYNLSSFLIVDLLRRGMAPKDAGLEALNRIKASTIEKHLLTSQGQPNFDVSFYILNSRREHAGVSMYEGAQYAVCTENGPQLLACEPLLQGKLAE